VREAVGCPSWPSTTRGREGRVGEGENEERV